MKKNTKASSTLISIVLILTVAASVAAIASVLPSNPPQDETESDELLLDANDGKSLEQVTVVKDGDVDTLKLNGKVVEEDVSVGDTINMSVNASTATIVATTDGEDEVVKRFDARDFNRNY